MKNKYLYYILPVLGTIFCLWYIFSATCDGIYSDYVRLVNSYLPDVWNPEKFFVPDVLTRIPVNYLGRVINVALFDYNIMFDRVLGVVALGLSGLVLAHYSHEKKISMLWFFVIMAVLFSLNKWEMLTNGSGWAHFLSFVLFYYHYELLDRVWNGKEGKKERITLILLPFITTLLIAGPYCAIYSVTVMAGGAFLFFMKKQKRGWSILYGMSALIPLLLYLWSNSYAVEDYAAPATGSVLAQLKETPGFFLRFFVKSFSSMVIGGEQAEAVFRTNWPFMILGMGVILLYLLALWYQWKYALYKETVFPLLIIISGGLNHVLIVASRWIFLLENYGMSSRYALQFQTGIIGILLTFALLFQRRKGRIVKKTALCKTAAAFSCMAFLLGNAYTTYIEVEKAPYRLENYEERAKLALRFEEATDEELRNGFEYRLSRPDSGAKVRSALTILKENGYSIFSGAEKESP